MHAGGFTGLQSDWSRGQVKVQSEDLIHCFDNCIITITYLSTNKTKYFYNTNNHVYFNDKGGNKSRLDLLENT